MVATQFCWLLSVIKRASRTLKILPEFVFHPLRLWTQHSFHYFDRFVFLDSQCSLALVVQKLVMLPRLWRSDSRGEGLVVHGRLKARVVDGWQVEDLVTVRLLKGFVIGIDIWRSTYICSRYVSTSFGILWWVNCRKSRSANARSHQVFSTRPLLCVRLTQHVTQNNFAGINLALILLIKSVK